MEKNRDNFILNNVGLELISNKKNLKKVSKKNKLFENLDLEYNRFNLDNIYKGRDEIVSEHMYAKINKCCITLDWDEYDCTFNFSFEKKNIASDNIEEDECWD